MAETERKRLTFDPTINAGHILTFVAMAIGVMTSYSMLDKRIGVLEERSTSAITQAADRQTEQKESLREIKSDVKDLQRSMNDIGKAIAGKRP